MCLCRKKDLSPAALQECDTNLYVASAFRVLSPSNPTLIAPNCRFLQRFLCRRECLTTNMPTAVTTLLFSGLVNVRRAFCAKLGSVSVRPFPCTCLGGILRLSCDDSCAFKLARCKPWRRHWKKMCTRWMLGFLVAWCFSKVQIEAR